MTTEKAVREELREANQTVNRYFASFAAALSEDPLLAGLIRYQLQQANQRVERLRQILHAVMEAERIRADRERDAWAGAEPTGDRRRFKVTYWLWLGNVDTEIGTLNVVAATMYRAQCEAERLLLNHGIRFDSTTIETYPDDKPRTTDQTGGAASTPVED